MDISLAIKNQILFDDIAAVPDDTIHSITSQLPFTNKLVAHTCGGAALEAISNTNKKGECFTLYKTFFKKQRD